jgi:acyl-CoA reductase-like NAD-dependent aldehyde dehydrogenase
MATEVREAVRLRLHIGGDWVEAASGETFESESPATGEVLAVVPNAGREDGRRAIKAAAKARHAMAALGVEERACLCEAIGERITGSLRNAFRAAERLECGVVNVTETAAYWEGRTPFGGYSGKSSGVGRLGGAATIESMSQLKSIVLDVGA